MLGEGDIIFDIVCVFFCFFFYVFESFTRDSIALHFSALYESAVCLLTMDFIIIQFHENTVSSLNFVLI